MMRVAGANIIDFIDFFSNPLPTLEILLGTAAFIAGLLAAFIWAETPSNSYPELLMEGLRALLAYIAAGALMLWMASLSLVDPETSDDSVLFILGFLYVVIGSSAFRMRLRDIRQDRLRGRKN